MDNKGIIDRSTKWMIKSKVAANLLMFVFLIGGLFMFTKTQQEFMPDTRLGVVNISVQYDGATPDEVEKSVVLAIEESVRDIDGVEKMSSTSSEGKGEIKLELFKGANEYQAYQDVKSSVDGITTFPKDAEIPIVSLESDKRDVMEVMFYGDLDELSLYNYVQEVKQELVNKDNISLVEIEVFKDREVSIEVSELNLRKYSLTLQDIADKISEFSVERGAGTLYTENREILLKIDERKESYADIALTPILTTQNGTIIYLGDIATIKDGFGDKTLETKFNGKPGVILSVYAVGGQTPIQVQNEMYEYLDSVKLPESLKYEIVDNDADYFVQRADILMKNAIAGLVLIMLILGVFLDPRLAFWVMLGLPISIIGSFLFIPAMDVSINMISMMAFIITLGVVVDDAIIVGENIYDKRLNSDSTVKAAILGVQEMTPSIIFAVLTNIIAFLPILFIGGEMGQFFKPIPVVLISVLAVSLIESLFILPAHLSHTTKKEPNAFIKKINIPRLYVTKKLEYFTNGSFSTFVKTAIKQRYIVLASAIGMIILCFGLITGGIVKLSLRPVIEGDDVKVGGEYEYGNPYIDSKNAVDIIIKSLEKTAADFNTDFNEINYETIIGKKNLSDDTTPDGLHKFSIRATLPSDRSYGSKDFATKWEKNTQHIEGVNSLVFSGQRNFAGSTRIELAHSNHELLEESSEYLINEINSLAGVRSVQSSDQAGKVQYNFKLKDKAVKLGITTEYLAQQVRNSFLGTNAMSQQVKYDEVTYKVKLPESERSSSYTLENLKVILPNKEEVFLQDLAEIYIERSYTAIEKTNGNRITAVLIELESEVDENIFEENIQKNLLSKLDSKYPGIKYGFEGGKKDDADSFSDMKVGFVIAIIVIYILLVLLFNNYVEPFIIITSIPFGAVGAVVGHLLMQSNFTLQSMIGLLALAGIVVNNGLVLVVTINSYLKKGFNIDDALIESSKRRFRPILLTSLTTFIGLIPILSETSHQAAFLIPMVISIAFGLIYSTVITLALVPALFKIFEDIGLKNTKKDII